MNLQSAWLTQGHFELNGDPLMQDIRKRIEAGIGRHLKISTFPAHAGWRNTFWWNERPGRYTEAQFFMSLASDYPVLSFGVSVEKGIEDAAFLLHEEPDSKMDRATWDWQRLIEVAPAVLGADVPQIAATVDSPVNIRMYASRSVPDPEGRIREHFAYVFDNGCWWQRHLGTATPEKIVERLHDYDCRAKWWVDVYFACDLYPHEVGGIGANAAGDLLLAFKDLRARLNARD